MLADQPMSNILVVFDVPTFYVAAWISTSLRTYGHTTSVLRADGFLPPACDFDAVVVGSRVLFGHHARSILEYVLANRDDLEAMPTAFFSLGAREVGDGALRKLGWIPTESVAFSMYAEEAHVSEFADRFHRDIHALAQP
jgi:flavodoxin-like protein